MIRAHTTPDLGSFPFLWCPSFPAEPAATLLRDGTSTLSTFRQKFVVFSQIARREPVESEITKPCAALLKKAEGILIATYPTVLQK